MVKVEFNNAERAISIGRNGSIITTGVVFCESLNDISIVPLTSRGEMANCAISIPRKDLKKFVEMIEKFIPEENNN